MKSDTSVSTGGSSSSSQFGDIMTKELRLKREAAFEVAKEKDRTVMRLEEMKFLAINTKDLFKSEISYLLVVSPEMESPEVESPEVEPPEVGRWGGGEGGKGGRGELLNVYPMYKAFIEPDLKTAHIRIVNKLNPFTGFQSPTYILKGEAACFEGNYVPNGSRFSAVIEKIERLYKVIRENQVVVIVAAKRVAEKMETELGDFHI
ncbi:hypothetical protein Tco_1123099 [Tanacetum coccineum]|uniref:Uncharacterized protein n=1 Tax=Tanacetum coccineum TaxID=301880 RepID=A0ABQ5J2E2_9ASTR